jgi:hypothetical protein
MTRSNALTGLATWMVMLLVVAGCAMKTTPPAAGTGGGAAPGSQPQGGASSGGAATEACAQLGATRVCCGNGTQTCQAPGELLSWGPCLDAQGSALSCAGCGELASCDGGAPTSSPPDMASAPPTACVCKPDSVRWCDENVPGVEWSKQQCTAASTWGPCVSSPPPAGCAGPDGYNPVCCAGLGLCCQDGVNGPFIGNCTATRC